MLTTSQCAFTVSKSELAYPSLTERKTTPNYIAFAEEKNCAYGRLPHRSKHMENYCPMVTSLYAGALRLQNDILLNFTCLH